VRRRQFITLLGGAVLTGPVVVRAQQPPMPVIGYLSARSPDDTAHLLEAFRKGLGEGGFVEGQNVAIEFRWALGHYDRLPSMVSELVARSPAILVSTGGEPAALAAKAATTSIPIVFAIGGDPVSQGLAASLSRPGGNSTGITLLTNVLEPKRLGLLREVMPQAEKIGVLVNPDFRAAENQLRDLEQAASAINLPIEILRANTDDELDRAFAALAQRRIPALTITASPFFDTRRNKLVALAARYAIPTMYHFREYTAAGGLMSYGIDPRDVYRQVGGYAARVLKGTKPADLPVMQATKFEFVINLPAMKALGLNIPAGLLSIADEVIE
jgi:putative ABC transport system substrate-binding protein